MSLIVPNSLSTRSLSPRNSHFRSLSFEALDRFVWVSMEERKSIPANGDLEIWIIPSIICLTTSDRTVLYGNVLYRSRRCLTVCVFLLFFSLFMLCILRHIRAAPSAVHFRHYQLVSDCLLFFFFFFFFPNGRFAIQIESPLVVLTGGHCTVDCPFLNCSACCVCLPNTFHCFITSSLPLSVHSSSLSAVRGKAPTEVKGVFTAPLFSS